jgi:outer membrane protein assembly factor BamB
MKVPTAQRVAFLFCLCFFPALPSSFAQVRGPLPGGHRGEVSALIRDPQGRILSAGADGFLEIWNTENNAPEERFQLTLSSISSMVLRPGKPEIAVIENDGQGLFRISVWNYLTKQNLFTLRFRDSLSYINYSAAGNFLIAARGGRTGVVFIHSETGEVLQSPQDLSGTVAFAATGRSERSMICYLASGTLSYWDLESGEEIRRFDVPPNISGPVLIGNNRFLAGFDSGGLVILDAVSGTLILRERNISGGKIITGNPGSTEFVCFAASGSAVTLYHLNINNSGRLETKNRRSLPSSFAPLSSGAVIASDAVVLGSSGGQVLVFRSSGGARAMETRSQERLFDAASSSEALAFLTGKNLLGCIPLDYTLLSQGGGIKLEDSGAYTNIAADPSGPSSFLLWQEANARTFPALRTFSPSPETGSASGLFLDRLSFRFPLRTVSILENKILFLDSVGSLRVTDRDSGEILFSYSSLGAQDASFIDGENIIIGRSAVSGNTPFLKVNIATGETVPLPYPAAIGAKVYRGSGTSIYGAAVIQNGTNPETVIISLNTSAPSQSRPLVEYGGEDTLFAMAEAKGVLASNLGGGAAALYRRNSPGGNSIVRPLERSSGLPFKILGGGRWFILLDTEGNITWHDPLTGNMLALFRIYENEWVLEKDGGLIRGRLTK